MQRQRCTGPCGLEKELTGTNFEPRDESATGFRHVCRDCINAYRRLRRPKSAQRSKVARLPPEPRTPEILVKQHQRDIELEMLRRENKGLVHKLAQHEKRDKIVESMIDFSAPPIIFKQPKKKDGKRTATAVALASDWHVEEPVEPEKVNGLNEYNLDIAGQRIERYAQSLLWLVDMHRSKFNISELILWLGGDLFSGYIHEELMEQAQLSPIESILWLKTQIVSVIDTLLARGDFEHITIPCTTGNHGRTTQKQRIATGCENSYEWLLYQQLAEWYRKHEPDRVTVVAPKSQLVFLDVYGQILRGAHGDQIAYQGGVGGIWPSLNKAIATWDCAQRADVTVIGHWHTYLSLPYVNVNGSLIGYTPYAVRIKAKFEPPQQSFFLMDSEYGKCCPTPIWVQEKRLYTKKSA